MKPLSASEYDRRREFQVAVYVRLLSPPERTPALWRRLSPSDQGVPVPAPANRWRAMSWGERWRRLRTTG
jgi:hypothetical protein